MRKNRLGIQRRSVLRAAHVGPGMFSFLLAMLHHTNEHVCSKRIFPTLVSVQPGTILKIF